MNEAQQHIAHTLVRPPSLHSSTPPPSLSPPLPFPSLIKKKAHTLPFSGLMTAAATNLDPSQRSIQDEDAECTHRMVRALGDMLPTVPPYTPLHTFRASAVPISPTSCVHQLLTPISLSAYPCALHCILLKLSNAHFTNPCVRGPRYGPRGYGPCCPCVDHPWCQHRSPGI